MARHEGLHEAPLHQLARETSDNARSHRYANAGVQRETGGRALSAYLAVLDCYVGTGAFGNACELLLEIDERWEAGEILVNLREELDLHHVSAELQLQRLRMGIPATAAQRSLLGHQLERALVFVDALRAGQKRGLLGGRDRRRLTLLEIKLSLCREQTNDIDRCLHKCMVALDAMEQEADASICDVELLLVASTVARAADRLADAEELSRRALGISRHRGWRGSEGAALHALAAARIGAGRGPSALPLLRRTIVLHRQSGRLLDALLAHIDLARLAWHTGRTRESISLHEQAIVEARTLDRCELEVDARISLAEILSLTGLGHAARQETLRAIGLARRMASSRQLIRAYGLLSNVRAQAGAAWDAELPLRLADRLIRCTDQPAPVRAIAAMQRARCLLGIGCGDEALEQTQAAVLELQEDPSADLQAMAFLIRGQVFLALGRLDEAVADLEKSERHFAETGCTPWWALAARGRAVAILKTKGAGAESESPREAARALSIADRWIRRMGLIPFSAGEGVEMPAWDPQQRGWEEDLVSVPALEHQPDRCDTENRGGNQSVRFRRRLPGRSEKAPTATALMMEKGPAFWSRYGIVTRNRRFHNELLGLARLAKTGLPIVVHGETGSGKELVSRAIHTISGLSGRFMVFNAGSRAGELLEAELFGHRRGAFTGAHSDREGLILQAQGGTLFLDEIADLDQAAQAALLRFLDRGEIRPVGSDRIVTVKTRIVAASHRRLSVLVAKGGFRRDLYFRLAGAEIHIPALRARPEDVPLLIRQFGRRHGLSSGEIECISTGRLGERMRRYPWPGNVRQLSHCVRHIAAMLQERLPMPHLERQLARLMLAGSLSVPSRKDRTRATGAGPTREELAELMRQHGGNIARVARDLHTYRTHVYRLLRQHGLDRERFRPILDEAAGSPGSSPESRGAQRSWNQMPLQPELEPEPQPQPPKGDGATQA